MTTKAFRKKLTANDVGATGAHQAGVHIPKTELELLGMLPFLSPKIKNPDAWLVCRDESGHELKFRYIYYNNRLHDEKGTRNEYRLTHMTKWFKDVGAKEGDEFEISQDSEDEYYWIKVIPQINETTGAKTGAMRIKLSSWRRVH